MSAQHEQNSFTTFKPPSMDGLKPHLDLGIDITTPPVKQSFWRRFIALLDVSLLKDRGYLNILFGLSIFYVAEMNFKMITPFFFASLGYSKTDVAYCLSITAISDISSRIILPPICDRFPIKKRTIFFVSILFVGVTRSSKYFWLEVWVEWEMKFLIKLLFRFHFSYGWTNRIQYGIDMAVYLRFLSRFVWNFTFSLFETKNVK